MPLSRRLGLLAPVAAVMGGVLIVIAAIGYSAGAPGQRQVMLEQRSTRSFAWLAECFDNAPATSSFLLREGRVHPHVPWETIGSNPVRYRARNDARHLTLEIEDDGSARTIRLYLRGDLAPRQSDRAVIRACALDA